MLSAQIAGAPRGYISGLILSSAGSVNFSVNVGECADTTTSVQMVLGTALAKTTSAWSAGNNGALDTGSIAASTWYHAYLIRNPSTGAVDVTVSTNASAPSLPSGYTQYRRVGSMKTDGSSHWTVFSQLGDTFLWSAPAQNLSNDTTSVTGTPNLIAVTTPKDIQTTALLQALALVGSPIGIINYYSPDQAAQAADGGKGQLVGVAAYCGGAFEVRTNTNSQVYVVANGSGSTNWLVTQGWIDNRGKD